jgi:hypothetical protein
MLRHIRTADDLTRAQEIITDALNAGAITPKEAVAVQSVMQQAWRSRLEAHEHRDLVGKEQIDREAYRERIYTATRSFGMVWSDGEKARGPLRPVAAVDSMATAERSARGTA